MVINKLKHILIFLIFQAFFLALSHGKTVKDARIKMLDGDYDVSVSSKSISHFKNKKLPIEYWIALEPDSTITK